MEDLPIRLCLVLHNHQPVGNFDYVFEQAYAQSYLPFLDAFESFNELKISLHTSGPLLQWLEKRHPGYLDRISRLVRQERVEIIGGAFYEPILTMITSRDRRGQIKRYTQQLNEQFDTVVRGMWIPERVWEASLVSDIADADIHYTVLDDFHFRCAGLSHDQLLGDYVAEDNGRTLRIFPGSEQLRYTIPFEEPHATIDYLHEIAQGNPEATIVFADDGEKFGSWPDTYQHVYEHGWLKRFFDALVENQAWLKTTTLAEAVEASPPLGKIYLPDASYREMTEWSLPLDRQLELQQVTSQMEKDWCWPIIKKFIRGGFWRNFKCKYDEANELYARMMYVSRRLEQAAANHGGGTGNLELLDQALDHLYQGQCNCAYWHGAFGGIYLPHLRNAIYRHLIEADNLIDRALEADEAAIEAGDFNFDLRSEIRLSNSDLICWFRPFVGGQMYGLDVRSIGHNLLATMQRRPEAYHEKVRQGHSQHEENAASIHDRVVFKQRDLDQKLIYDSSPRKSLIDHFWHPDVTFDELVDGQAKELGDFVHGTYQSKLRRDSARNQILMSRDGWVDGQPIKITKGVTLHRTSQPVSIGYLLEGLPRDRDLHFAIEFNFAGLPNDADDRQFLDGAGQPIGELGKLLDVSGARQLKLVDQWLGLQIDLSWDQPGGIWTFPIQTVSQSEAGFELVHQSVVVQPHWRVRGDSNGRWAVKFELGILTSHDPARKVDEAPITTKSD